MIIHDPHLMWLTVKPFEDDSPLIINPDGVEIPEITLQFLQSIRWRHREVFKATRCVYRFQLALHRTRYTLKSAHEFILEQCLR